MTLKDWPVLFYSIRPAGKPDECYYCDRKLGETHDHECLIRERTIVVEAKVRYTINVPECWGSELIEHYLNDSSACSGSRLIDDLIDIYDGQPREDKQGNLEENKDPDDCSEDEEQDDHDSPKNCLCSQITWEFIGEADQVDEDRDGIHVSNLPS